MLNFIKNKVLDSTIYLSFDRTGFKRHELGFSELIDDFDMADKTTLVTGASSGIGFTISEELSKLGSSVIVLSRRKPTNLENLNYLPCDLGDYQQTLNCINEINHELDFLVLNAGGMPDTYTENKYGHEQQFASQLMGHFILMRSLIDQGKVSKKTKVIWTSSGGMYLVKYNHSMIQMNPEKYDKVSAYANVKRAQVILSSYFAKNFSPFNAVMHPGWVETEAVKSSIPKFYEFTQKRLRSPRQGADTILWLLGTKEEIPSGEFWFDRKQVKKVAFPWTKNSKEECDQLFNFCESFYQSLIREK